MFKTEVLKLFRKSFGHWVTAAPPRPKPRPTFKPRLEWLEDRFAPATVNMYWDPTSGNNASTIVGGQAVNWDTGSLGSGNHPTAAPGNTAGETDNIYFDGSTGKGGNVSCTWDYKPSNDLGEAGFQNAWTQTLSFTDQSGFSVSSGLGAFVTGQSTPTLAPNGNSGANAVAGITLKNGNLFNIEGGNKLTLQGWASGNAVFIAGDGKAGEYLANAGTVIYKGQSSQTDYLKIPVLNSWSGGVFQVQSGTLQVSGTDSNTQNVSFYQNSGGETDISGSGTLWCVNNYRMDAGLLQTKDSSTDKLEVGTGGSSPVDGTVYLLGGNVKINPGSGVYGKLQIMGTTAANNPILDAGSVVLNFKVDMTPDSSECDVLYVGSTSGSGTVNFNYNGGSSTVAINAQGGYSKPHAWKVLYFGPGKVNGVPTLSPATGFAMKWNSNNLEIDTTS